MLSIFKKLFNFNDFEVQRFRKIVDTINALEEKAKKLKDEDFKKETEKLKKIVNGDPANLEAILPWAYALVREASVRTLGMRHFDVQLIGGLVLHEGKIAEQKTGEGKTLSATTALYANALVGKGAHLVTVNDYLVRRDAGWMGKIYDFLGLTTSAIISEKSFIYDPSYVDNTTEDWRLQHLRPVTRKEAYLADITYGINSEYGFDYLRDNMALSSEDLVQRGYYFAVVDEVDSVLIDEARTPHIISAPVDDDTSKYYKYAQIVERLSGDSDYIIDEKMRTANLTERGVLKIEKMIGVENVYEKDYDTLFHVEAALKARALFKRDKDYIVRNDQVVIVDEFTGRLLEGRRFSEGIHQAIEAKERVAIQKESKTLATISLQNYFRMYKKLAGMTGTAATEAEEFHKIYKLDVIAIPTHQKMIRKDEADFIFKTERGKFTAIAEEIAEINKIGRPILVGTTSIDKNELLSSLLKKKGIRHEVLNAKNHEREALIISNAGKKGAVTIATNMAGRGVDIILGGTAPSLASTLASPMRGGAGGVNTKISEWQKDHDEVVAAGGLYIIGTERHESRRIDNQLRGRSGRQGDPGSTRFFISLEDDMLRIFGGDQIQKMMTFFNFPENQPIEHSLVSKAIEQAQVKVEGFNFDVRKHLLEYDDVLNKQREVVYSARRRAVQMEHAKDEMNAFMDEQLQKLIETYEGGFNSSNEEQRTEVILMLENLVKFTDKEKEDVLLGTSHEARERALSVLKKTIAEKQKKYGAEVFSQAIKFLFLSTVDFYFTEHLTSIEDLREGINLRGYAQLDPLVEYKKESFRLFNTTLESIRMDFLRRIYHVEISNEQREAVEQQSTAPKKLGLPAEAPSKRDAKVGRNDPCYCGSGKKYKRCHYPN